MLKSVGEYGRGLKPPSYHEVRVSHLKKAVDKIQESLVKYKKDWEKWGCTLMCDGWTDGKGRSLTNFLVNSPSGTVFLKSVDTSSVIKDAKQMFELLDNMIEEIGEDNVVQVVTDGASNLVAAGKMLEEKRKKLFWSPCAAHCLDLVLEDIGQLPVFYNTITNAKKITTFIYRHTWVLNLYRKYSKGRELARPAVTRFATAYLTLSCIFRQKNALRTMFASDDWVSGSFASKSEGKQVADMIFGDSRFWSSIKYCLKCVSPLVKVLRLVDGDSKPAMPYIYEAMDRAKEEIADNFEKKESRYKKIWKIIDTRWNLQLHRPLHAAAYFLNPKFHYDEKFNADQEVYFGLYETIERMIPDRKTRFLVDQQLEAFKSAKGLFGRSMAIDTRNKKQPALWWESYGGEGKELQKIAMRILSLTCSATGCERNWSTFDQIHTKRRNRLEQQRLNALVFVKYNLQLEMRQKIREEKGETYDPICLSDIESDDEWITEKENPCLPVDGSWMDIHESFTLDEGAPSKKRKRGPRNLNAKTNSKGKSIVEQENENEDNVEDGEEEDDEEMTLLMENDHELSDIDLGDDE
ncbi:uncharacterized protein LOC114712623 [Neltuma alba]|uniref:uncharacterized protein LOC114712623 n=1 Tax=Neltuma alba TaxID=207710 RepID=UPI0010A2AF77|nr:uncharacterized protein LOC114712623 [Prosopis alba]